MRAVVLGERELGPEVLLEHRLLLDGLEQGGVNSLLVGLALVGHDGGLALVVKELLLVGRGGTGKVLVVDGGGDLDARHVDLRGGGNDVGLVDALQRHAVDLVGARDKEEAGLKDLEGVE